jgi:hypothetical protein
MTLLAQNPKLLSGYFVLSLVRGVFVQTLSGMSLTSWRKEPEETFGMVEKTDRLTYLLQKEGTGKMLTNSDRIFLNNLTRQFEIDELSAGLFLYLKRKENSGIEAQNLIERTSTPGRNEMMNTVKPENQDVLPDQEDEERSSQNNVALPGFSEFFLEEEDDQSSSSIKIKRTRRSKRRKSSRYDNLDPVPDLVAEEEVDLFIEHIQNLSDFFAPEEYDKLEEERTEPPRKNWWQRIYRKEEDNELEE